ncbi:glucan biosynthesis protein G [Pigmentiphaga humi]|nr:glucan biosynthesis protein G [Pigmentiphaga humi]
MLAAAGTAAVQAFTLDDVTARARQLIEQPYAAPVSNLPPVFSKMEFADYLRIQPRRDKFEWQDLATPFKLAFYHQGMHFSSPVAISEVVDGKVHEIKYDPAKFDFGGLNFDAAATRNLGYAGFRVLYPINRDGVQDEIMSLLGASYFRVIGKGQIYGLSARGLAIDTAWQDGMSEEFPRFREFWVERPKPQDRELVIYALMDSPRATGAYRFVLRPGEDTVVDVQSRVFVRGEIHRLGVAPLTSMFLYGPNQGVRGNNFRPALHDSNGLAIHTGDGQWLWRPLNNPEFLSVSAFQVTNPKGFGLLQRGHEFHRYEDLADRYDLRPSAWIEPQGDWGPGQVQLVEIPTADETNDNIGAFWTPEKLPPKGQPMRHDYRIHWTLNEPALLEKEVGWVKQTLRTDGEVRQANLIRQLDGSTAFMIDFEGPVLAGLPNGTTVNAQVDVGGNGEVLENVLQRNPAIQGWRLTLRVKVKDPRQPLELRAALVDGKKALTETWSYQLPARSVRAP